MKPIFKVSLLAATVLLAVGCQKDEAAPKADTTQTQTTESADKAATKTDTATANKIDFKSEDDKAAYALGSSFTKYLQENLSQPEEFGIKVNQELLFQGIQDTFYGKAALNDDEVKEALDKFQEKVTKKTQEITKEKAEKAKKEGAEYRAKFEKEEGVKKTESGLLYKVITPAKDENAPSPKATDTVVVNYKGTLPDGTEFDNSYTRKAPATFPLNQVIPGWTEGVQLMKVGEKMLMVLPPELGYGEQSQSKIPGNSTLIFEVELEDVKDPKDVIQKQASQQGQGQLTEEQQKQIQAALEQAAAQQNQ